MVLLISSVLSGHLWFLTQTQHNAYIVSPVAQLTAPCQCQVTVEVIRVNEINHNRSQSRQQTDRLLPANEKVPLANLSLSMPAGEQVTITVTLADSQHNQLQATQQIPETNESTGAHAPYDSAL